MSNVYEEILNNSNIQTILEHYGLKVVKNKCNCPFHNDTHPSMSVHTGKGIAKCFVCGSGGNAISFIQKYENEVNHNAISIRDAMQKAIDIQHLNIVVPTNNKPLTEEQKKNQRLNNILKDAITISRNNLKVNNLDCQNALKYLKSRNLSTEIINQFHIGFDVGTNNIMNNLLQKYSLDELKEVGIVKDYNNNYIDVFSNRITIPIFDENGNPVGFGARAINDTIKPKYLNTRETELFNKSNLLFNYHQAKSYARNDELIIVEGYMDVISAKAMKIDNVVGSMGTALTKEHIDLIKKLKCEVTLCLDNDQAGIDAMIRIIPDLLKANLKVNVLEIAKLGNYKDFGDLQMANVTKEQVYQTKISAFTFLLKYKYIKNNELTVENIHKIYNEMWKDKVIKDTKDTLIFKEYISNNSDYSNDELDKIINPTEINIENRVDRYKDVFFYSYIISLIKNYATKRNDNILLKYIESGQLNSNILMETINSENYLKDGELTINIGSYIRDFLFKTDDYIKFKKDKAFILENLLNNVKSFDSKGNVIDIELTKEQKELVIKQYNDSFDSKVRDYIENNTDEFEEIFISNNNSQFKSLFPKTYKEAFKEQAISRYSNEGVMEAIRYGLAYTDDMKSVMARQFVNNGKYKTLLVFNNNKNILELSEKNIKQISKEENMEIEKVKTEENAKKEEIKETKAKNPMSIFINISGQEKETYKGIYIPINEEKQVFIPKQLYRKNDKKIEILNNQANHANMSEYTVNTNENTKKFTSRLTLDDFYKKYFRVYEVQREKEVMA